MMRFFLVNYRWWLEIEATGLHLLGIVRAHMCASHIVSIDEHATLASCVC